MTEIVLCNVISQDASNFISTSIKTVLVSEIVTILFILYEVLFKVKPKFNSKNAIMLLNTPQTLDNIQRRIKVRRRDFSVHNPL